MINLHCLIFGHQHIDYIKNHKEVKMKCNKTNFDLGDIAPRGYCIKEKGHLGMCKDKKGCEWKYFPE